MLPEMPGKRSDAAGNEKENGTGSRDEGGRKPVERLFPFALRARAAVVGRETLRRSRSKLACLLMATDISENSRREIHRDFSRLPIIERYSSAELERWFHFRNCRVLGLRKSDIARSILRELREVRDPH